MRISSVLVLAAGLSLSMPGFAGGMMGGGMSGGTGGGTGGAMGQGMGGGSYGGMGGGSYGGMGDGGYGGRGGAPYGGQQAGPGGPTGETGANNGNAERGTSRGEEQRRKEKPVNRDDTYSSPNDRGEQSR